MTDRVRYPSRDHVPHSWREGRSELKKCQRTKLVHTKHTKGRKKETGPTLTFVTQEKLFAKKGDKLPN